MKRIKDYGWFFDALWLRKLQDLKCGENLKLHWNLVLSFEIKFDEKISTWLQIKKSFWWDLWRLDLVKVV